MNKLHVKTHEIYKLVIEKADQIETKLHISHLEGLDGGHSVLVALVVVAGEGAFEHGSRVPHVDRLLHSHVPPVGHLDQTLHGSHRQEGRVVLIVHRNVGLRGKFSMFNQSFYYCESHAIGKKSALILQLLVTLLS